MFLFDLVMKLSQNINIKKYIIKPVKDKQSFNKLIYSLKLIKFEMLKTYIKIHSKIRFIQSFESLANASILFNKNFNDSFCLYIDY